MSQTTPSKPPAISTTWRRTALAAGIVGAITVASGVLHGRQTHRWGTPDDLNQAADELQAFPRLVGPWETVAEEELTAATLKVLHDPGYVLRTYRNQVTGETVKLAILVGPPGPIAVHTPEICYSSRAYALPAEPEAVTLADGDAHQFWKLMLDPQELSEPPLVVYYAWGTGDAWTAARNPRFSYGNRRFLYKLQLAVARPADDRVDDDAGRHFLQDFLETDFRLPVAD